eukprot:COSAG02_NODE_2953_length_7672_cov_2.308464_2_plen_65_part_00
MSLVSEVCILFRSTCHAGEAKDDDVADARMVGLVILLQKLATEDPSSDVARTATQLVNLGLAET